jgi:hypothetical protein
MTVQVKQNVAKIVDGQPVETGEKRIVKEKFLPEAFGVEIEIEFWPKQPVTSMY